MSTWDSNLHSGFGLGEFVVRPDQCVIENATESQRLEPKTMEVLLYLANRPGEVVSRNELIEQVWQTVVNDEALSRAVSLLRSHLGDDPRAPQYIQTIPKKGYRLLVAPKAVVQDDRSEISNPAPPQASARVLPISKPWLMITGLCVLLIVVSSMFNTHRDANQISGEPDKWRNWFEEIVVGSDNSETLTSLAVLPFDDLSEDRHSAFLRDTITDELILALSKVQGLKVVARRSILNLPDSVSDVRSAGRYFGVDAILEGTVKTYGDRLRISAQLGSTQDGFILWSETYDKPVGDLFRLQKSIIGAITEQLQKIAGNGLTPPAESNEHPDLDAYQTFLSARYLVKLRGVAALRRSVPLFEQAIASDPSFARAHLGLARVTALMPFYDNVDDEAMYTKALGILDALDLQPQDKQELSEAESIRGFVSNHRWQWRKAEEHYVRAFELNPRDPGTFQWYSSHLSSVGHMRDSLEAARRAMELDAASPVVAARLAVAYLWLNDDVSAAEYFARGAEHGISSDANLAYVLFLFRQQRWGEALRFLRSFLATTGHDSAWVEPLIEYFSGGATRDRAIEELVAAKQNGQLPQRLELPIWLLLDEPVRVAGVVERYRNEKQFLITELFFIAEAEPFRKSKYWNDVVKVMELEAYWDEYGLPDWQR